MDKWRDEEVRECWLRSIGQSHQDEICVYSFENELAADGLLSWQQIEEEGAEFLGALQNLTQKQEVGVST